MTSMQILMDVGKELGLTGDELRAFIKEEQDRERDLRLAERQAEKEKLDADRQTEKDRLDDDVRLSERTSRK